jgi:uncharacterized membrane-anchored protein YitT (DUF2179 family)
MDFSSINIKNNLIEILGTIIGAAIMAAGISFFLLPNQLSSGGFSGLATITYYLLHIPMGTMILILNIPLFVISIYKIGKKFFIKSLIGTISLSIFIDFFDKFNPLTEDRFLACIYGGIIIGIGTAIILKFKSSTGGTDLVSNIIREYNSRIRMGTVIVIIDTIIIALNVIFFKEVEIGLYSAIAIYLDGKMIDIIFEGIYFTKLLFIISDKNEEIAQTIEEKIKRGVTGLYGKGMYTKNDKLVLVCAAPRGDVARIKELAQKIDKNCFIILSNAREVFGEGFK